MSTYVTLNPHTYMSFKSLYLNVFIFKTYDCVKVKELLKFLGGVSDTERVER